MPHYENEMVEFDAELKNETERAWIVVIDGKDHSLPKSKCKWHASKDQVSGSIEVPTWLAEKEGLG